MTPCVEMWTRAGVCVRRCLGVCVNVYVRACSWQLEIRCGKPYGATPPFNTYVQLTNLAPFEVTIKQVFPCEKQAGPDLAKLKPGMTYVATTVSGNRSKGVR